MWKKFITAKKRRRKHKKYVKAMLWDLRYKVINLALLCQRGDLSEQAFLRRSLNTAKLIHRYETKLKHLNRLVG